MVQVRLPKEKILKIWISWYNGITTGLHAFQDIILRESPLTWSVFFSFKCTDNLFVELCIKNDECFTSEMNKVNHSSLFDTVCLFTYCLHSCSNHRQNEDVCISIVYSCLNSKCSCNNAWHIFISFRHRVWSARVGNLLLHYTIRSATMATNESSSTIYILYKFQNRHVLLIFLSTWIQVSVPHFGFGISSKTFLYPINPSGYFSFVVLNKVIRDPNTVERSQGHLKIDIAFLSEEHSLTWLLKGKAAFTYKLMFSSYARDLRQGNSAII